MEHVFTKRQYNWLRTEGSVIANSCDNIGLRIKQLLSGASIKESTYRTWWWRKNYANQRMTYEYDNSRTFPSEPTYGNSEKAEVMVVLNAAIIELLGDLRIAEVKSKSLPIAFAQWTSIKEVMRNIIVTGDQIDFNESVANPITANGIRWRLLVDVVRFSLLDLEWLIDNNKIDWCSARAFGLNVLWYFVSQIPNAIRLIWDDFPTEFKDAWWSWKVNPYMRPVANVTGDYYPYLSEVAYVY